MVLPANKRTNFRHATYTRRHHDLDTPCPQPTTPRNRRTKPLANTIRTHESSTLTIVFRSSSGIRGHWPPSAHRGQPYPGHVPHDHLRPQHHRRQVPFLVLPARSPQGEEGDGRDCLRQGHCREAPPEGQELWHLDPLRLTLRHPQHVQGVPRDEPHRRRRGSVL
ncbi:hypothetical protein CRV24_002342 [Beauveria bassiana]|nr:hypothetical protein CRV24_002342 [Beauveria bassiana]